MRNLIGFRNDSAAKYVIDSDLSLIKTKTTL